MDIVTEVNSSTANPAAFTDETVPNTITITIETADFTLDSDAAISPVDNAGFQIIVTETCPNSCTIDPFKSPNVLG